MKEFRPAFLFLGKFLLIYIVGNVLYGIYIESYGDNPDPVTRIVTVQSVVLLNSVGYSSSCQDSVASPTVLMNEGRDLILRVYEGCNGINVMIVFAAFLFAFQGRLKTLVWFLPVGLITIHLANLFRIALLYHIAIQNEQFFYYFHKYFFTAILYLIVFALWAVWVIKLNKVKIGNAENNMAKR
jgi:exosortase family protein XrtF